MKRWIDYIPEEDWKKICELELQHLLLLLDKKISKKNGWWRF